MNGKSSSVVTALRATAQTDNNLQNENEKNESVATPQVPMTSLKQNVRESIGPLAIPFEAAINEKLAKELQEKDVLIENLKKENEILISLLGRAIDLLVTKGKVANREKSELRTELASARSNLEDVTEKLKTNQASFEAAKKELSEKTVTIEELQNEIKKQNKRNDVLNNITSQSKLMMQRIIQTETIMNEEEAKLKEYKGNER